MLKHACILAQSTGKRPRPSIEAPEPVKRARSKGKEAEASTHNGNTDTFKRCTPANSKQSPEAQLAMFRVRSRCPVSLVM